MPAGVSTHENPPTPANSILLLLISKVYPSQVFIITMVDWAAILFSVPCTPPPEAYGRKYPRSRTRDWPSEKVVGSQMMYTKWLYI